MEALLRLTGLDRPEVERLHPKMQENLVEARETIEEMIDLMNGHHISDLGIVSAYEGVTEAFYAALDQTGEKANLLGYQPMSLRIGPRTERYEVPSPVVVTIGSSTSQSAALVLVTFNAFNPVNGYGDWNDVEMNVIGIHDSLDDAKKFLGRIAKAFATLESAGREMDKLSNPVAKKAFAF